MLCIGRRVTSQSKLWIMKFGESGEVLIKINLTDVMGKESHDTKVNKAKWYCSPNTRFVQFESFFSKVSWMMSSKATPSRNNAMDASESSLGSFSTPSKTDASKGSLENLQPIQVICMRLLLVGSMIMKAKKKIWRKVLENGKRWQATRSAI